MAVILTAENLTKQYIETKVLDGASLYINSGDKIGVVGVNGTGKSTLLKIIAGELECDSGTITTGKGVRIAYLPQNPEFVAGHTVLQEALRNAVDPQAQEYQVKSVLNRLGLTGWEEDVAVLSGGQKKRLALASVLATPSDLLILDEPTNHIDSEMVQWLEDLLGRRTGALLMITHDRYFLDRVSNRIVEVDRGSLYDYPGNYSVFLETKAAREEIAAAGERKRQSILRNELAWMMRGARARSTKQKARIERFEELRDRSAPQEQEQVEIQSVASRLGGQTIEAQGIAKAYGGRQLVADFSYIVNRRDRLGIIGPNGCGKSTLMKLLSGRLAPDGGTVTIGKTVKIGYFSQEYEDMDVSAKVIDYIRAEAETIETAEGRVSAAQMLERFLFPPEIQWTKISRLSGGERRRLYLLKVLISAPNILFLDEPTNDLDIQTLGILEDYLDSFPGAVITVSHDRFFLDRVVTHLFCCRGNGVWAESNGGYTDYYENVLSVKNKEEKHGEKKKEPPKEREKPVKLKFTYKEQKEYEAIDDVLASLEEEIADVKAKLNAGSSDYQLLQELSAQLQELEEKHEYTTERWLYLTDLAERIEAQKK